MGQSNNYCGKGEILGNCWSIFSFYYYQFIGAKGDCFLIFFVAQEAGMGTISTGAAVDSGTALANNSAIHDYVNGYLFSTLFVITGYVYIHEIYQVHL